MYVRRCFTTKGAGIAGAKYGIVDTEDGIETIISWAQLAGILQNSPLDIKGVQYEWSSTVVNGKTRKYPRIVRIGVYRGAGTLPDEQITTV